MRLSDTKGKNATPPHKPRRFSRATNRSWEVMEWLCKNAGIGQHALLLEEPGEHAASRKGYRAARQSKNHNPDCSDMPLLQQDRPFSPEKEDDGWNWASNTGASSPSNSKVAHAGEDNWNDWDTGDAAWEPVTTTAASKAKPTTPSSSKSPAASKSPPTKTPSTKSVSGKSLSAKKAGDEKLLIDFGEEGGQGKAHDWDSGWDDDGAWEDATSGSSRGYQRISTKAD